MGTGADGWGSVRFGPPSDPDETPDEVDDSEP